MFLKVSFFTLLVILFLAVALQLYINASKEPISVNFQHYESTTRMPMESPIMNNVVANNINNSINLIDGLKLRVPERSYKFRCGNFLDIYGLALGFNKVDDHHAGKIVKFLENKSGKIGLVCDLGSKNGLTTFLGVLRAVLEHNIRCASDENKLELILLNDVPRFKEEQLSYLILDNLNNAKYLNGSEKWYEKVFVASETFSSAGLENFVSLSDVSESIPFDQNIITLDSYLKLDNSRLFQHKDTVFTQNNLVSAVSSFLSILPREHFLTSSDVYTVLLDKNDKSFNNIQLLFKLLAVLMIGGNVNVVNVDENEDIGIPPDTTILQFSSTNISRLLAEGEYHNLKRTFGYRLSKTLQLENVFKRTLKTKYDSIRMILVSRMITQPVSSAHMSLLKTVFQSRAILETYIPMDSSSVKTFGPVFATNLFDHRVFSSAVEKNVTFAGTVYPSLQFKLLKKESDNDRIGALKLRGFTIGLPIGNLKEKYANEIGKDSDGWVSVYGVDGCIGNDTCFWQMNGVV